MQLALDHGDDGFAGGSEVVAGVELGGFGGEDFADFGGHGEAEIGVDVDFADAVFLHGHGDLVFGDAFGVGHGAAVFVDAVDKFLGDAGGAVHDEGETRAGFHDFFDAVEGELGFVLELEGAVGSANGDGEGVDAGAFDEVGGLDGIGEEFFDVLFVFFGIESDDVFFNSAEHAEFGFDDDADGVCVIGALLGDLDVVFVVVV